MHCVEYGSFLCLLVRCVAVGVVLQCVALGCVMLCCVVQGVDM